jgi:hypothetical protein
MLPPGAQSVICWLSVFAELLPPQGEASVGVATQLWRIKVDEAAHGLAMASRSRDCALLRLLLSPGRKRRQLLCSPIGRRLNQPRSDLEDVSPPAGFLPKAIC